MRQHLNYVALSHLHHRDTISQAIALVRPRLVQFETKMEGILRLRQDDCIGMGKYLFAESDPA